MLLLAVHQFQDQNLGEETLSSWSNIHNELVSLQEKAAVGVRPYPITPRSCLVSLHCYHCHFEGLKEQMGNLKEQLCKI